MIRLLKVRDYSLLANRRTQKAAYRAGGPPILSVDAKKKELIGDFKKSGTRWLKEPIQVNVHDFPQDALGRAVPYGIYDIGRHHGSVYAGDSAETSEFAVGYLAHGWETLGSMAYPKANRMLIRA